MISFVAIPFVVLEVSNDRTSALADVAAACVIPSALSLLFGGWAVDRWGARKVSVVSDLLAAAAMIAVSLAHAKNLLTTNGLLILLVLATAFCDPGNVARQSIFPKFSADAGWAPERANAAYSFVLRGVVVFGPLLAMALLTFMSAPAAIFVDGATFIGSALIVYLSTQRTVGDSREARTGKRQGLLAGVLFILNHKSYRLLCLVLIMLNIGLSVSMQFVLPLLAKDVLGRPEVNGMLIAALAVGTIAGGLASAPMTSWTLTGRFQFVWPIVVSASGAVCMVVAGNLAQSMIATALLGFGPGFMGPIAMTLVSKGVPPERRGSVFASTQLLINIALALVLLAIGRFSPTGGAVTLALALLALVAGLLFDPREIRHAS